MRKPISKQALRRALERVRREGFLSWEHPTGTVIDQIWHELERASYKASRKKPLARETVRKAAVPELLES